MNWNRPVLTKSSIARKQTALSTSGVIQKGILYNEENLYYTHRAIDIDVDIDRSDMIVI